MKRIAIIDDEELILDSVKQYLSRSKRFKIDTFTNPQEALKEVLRAKYKLIVLDIMMPELNGIDFLQRVKKEVPQTKVIMMTAYSTLDKAILSKEIGADDYLTKPFVSLRDVENKVLDCLEIH
ncbi:MAG: response regulator [Campylobacteraceae bacterium]|nr:response regulator [Campylobacteraceae bacterium]